VLSRYPTDHFGPVIQESTRPRSMHA